MSELRTFTPADRDDWNRLARERVAAHRGRPHHNAFRDDPVAANRDGFRGEWAVADSLEIPRTGGPQTGIPDGGIDLIAPNGDTINVRYNRRPDGDLLTPVDRPFVADVAVLVVATAPDLDDPLDAEIIGGIRSDAFHQDARVRSLRVPSFVMGRRGLMPWAPLRYQLTNRALTLFALPDAAPRAMTPSPTRRFML